MTEAEFQQATDSGNVNVAPPSQDPPLADPTTVPLFDEYQPLIESIRRTRQPLTTAPTFTPKTFADSIQYYDDGSSERVYFYFSGDWHLFSTSPTVTESEISLSDVTTDDVSSTEHGFAPKSPADATKFLNGDATPAYAQVKDSDLSTSDITDNNVTTSEHGFAPKAPNDASKYLNGSGTWSVPATQPSRPTFDNALYLGAMSAGANTVSFTCGGIDRVLIVAVYNNSNDASPSGVTYNGVALTELNHLSVGSTRFSYWYLLSPALGTYNIVVTMPGSDGGYAGAVSLTNSVSQIVRNFASATGAGADPGITVTSAANSLIVDALYDDHTNSHTEGGGQSKVAAGTNFVGMSYKDATAPSTGMSFSGSTAGIIYHVGAEIVF